MKIGTHFIKAWSKTQATRALSSAEAELYAVVKATSEGIGIRSIMKDFGKVLKICILADASAALGIVRRKGVGRVRHLDTDLLWVQDKNDSKEVAYVKVEGSQNPADLLTKYLSSTDTRRLLEQLDIEYRVGRDDHGLTIHSVSFESFTELRALCRRKSTHARRGGVREQAPSFVQTEDRSISNSKA